MKRLITILFIALYGLGYSQTADEIISKHIEHTGGLTQWKLLNSILLEGKVMLSLEEAYPVKILQERPNLNKTIFTIDGEDYTIEGYNGEAGYSMNFATKKLVKDTQYSPESFDSDFIDYKAKGFTAQYLGKKEINGEECYVVELTKNVNKNRYYFDTDNYSLLREVKNGETLNYSQFKKVGKLTMPFRIEASTENAQGNYVILFHKIVLNKAFPKDAFKF